MFRTLFLASRLLICTAGAALAQPMLPGPASAGAEVRMSGSGDDTAFEYHGRLPSQAGRLATLGGGTGGGPEVTYLAPVPPGERGRIARLMGSREDATVIYLDEQTATPRIRG